MAQQTGSEDPNRHTSEAISGMCGLLEGVTIHMNVGLDEQGQSHFHAVEDGLIVVCDGDRRCKGIREKDIDQTIVLSGEKTVEDYAKFVQDRRGWDDLRSDIEHRAFGPDDLRDSE